MKKMNLIISESKKTVPLPKGSRLLARRCCNAVVQMEKVTDSVEIFLTLTDNAGLKAFKADSNQDFDDGVISFPSKIDGEYMKNSASGAMILGDILLSTEKASFRAKTTGRTMEREIVYMTTRGVLGLLGYRYSHDPDKAIICEKVESVMDQLGFPVSMSYLLNNRDL